MRAEERLRWARGWKVAGDAARGAAGGAGFALPGGSDAGGDCGYAGCSAGHGEEPMQRGLKLLRAKATEPSEGVRESEGRSSGA